MRCPIDCVRSQQNVSNVILADAERTGSGKDQGRKSFPGLCQWMVGLVCKDVLTVMFFIAILIYFFVDLYHRQIPTLPIIGGACNAVLTDTMIDRLYVHTRIT